MQKLQFKPYHATLIVDLNEDDCDRRSQSSEIYLEKFNYDLALVDHILWSDECKFNRNGTVNCHNCPYWSTENPHARLSVTNTEERMTVKCYLSSKGLFSPYFFDEIVMGSTYRQTLVDYAWPQLQWKRLYFQHNGATPHYAVIVREWLDEKFRGCWVSRDGPFEWPACSPDLTPCDCFLWVYLKDIAFKESFTSIIQLQNRIQDACAGVTTAIYGTVCHSVPNDYVTV